MNLKLKLPLAFAAISILASSTGLFGIYRMTTSVRTYEKVIQVDYANASAVAAMQVEFKTQVQEWKDVLLRGKDPQQLAKYWSAFQAHEHKVAEASVQLRSAIADGDARALLDRFAQAHGKMGEDYRKGYAAFTAANFEPSAGDAAVKGKDRAPAELLKQANQRILDLTASSLAQAAENNRRTVQMSLLLMLLSFSAALLAAWYVTRDLLRQLGGEPAYAVAATRRIAGGDLGAAIETRPADRSSLLFSIKEMQDNLARIVGDVRSGTERIATASGEIASGNLDLSSRTEQQAASLEETASSMEQLTATVRQNADNARQANQLALLASGVAQKGGAVVSQVVHTMESINDSSKRIVDIIAVIDGIAFQTNILALNAAVEAARAGEQGRGFAVVAAEVRTLAQRSAAAAREIKALIGSSVDKVGAGSRLVVEAGHTMEEIVGSVQRVTDIMSEIMAAGAEQSAGIEQVNQAIGQMDQATQQNAALVEQAAAASASMREEAGRLAQTVAVFRLVAEPAD